MIRSLSILALACALVACSDTGSAGGGGPSEDVAQDPDGGIIEMDAAMADLDAAADPDVAPDSDTATAPDTAPDLDADPAGDSVPDTVPDMVPDAEPEVVADITPEITPEITEDVPPETSVLTAMITTPTEGTVVEEGTLVSFQGVVQDSVYGDGELALTWTVDGDVVLEGPPGLGGWMELSHTFETPGTHIIVLEVENPDADVASDELSLGVCTYGIMESFDAPLAAGGDWTVYGDAFWDPGGWLEMTGNVQGKKGAIFNTAEMINPGDVEIHFSIWTGGGINSGADGFAMSVVNVPDVPTLETFINTAANGGCLGYGVSGECGSMALDAFHIEFDTWENLGDVNYDPTPQNHVAITLDGDPSNHVLWVNQMLEDSAWHDVTIQTVGQQIVVTFDGTEIINDVVPTFQFHGGYIGFTGVTGWATNFHRFDDLQVLQACVVP